MPSTAIRVDTIRDLILDGYEISIHCRAYSCTNRVKADLALVARRRGLDWQWFGKRWPYRCDRCGSHDVGMQLLPDVRPNSAPDRVRDLAAAKALVAEIEDEELGRGRGVGRYSVLAPLCPRQGSNGRPGPLCGLANWHLRRGECR
jgi:hypothetical protein